MKPFRFSLQSIRVIREQRERDAQQRFGVNMQACEKATYRLQQASDELAAGWNTLCQDLAAGVSATKLLKARAWCNVLEERQQQRRAELLAAQRAMDEAWRDMMLATRDREALDHYHDKCRRAYDREVQRDEQKMLDELGVRRAMAGSALRGSEQTETELN